MGEYADMILEGETCQECGEYLEDACGYPRSCEECNYKSQLNNRPESHYKPRTACEPRQKVSCPVCKKRVNSVGIKDHMRDAHGDKK